MINELTAVLRTGHVLGVCGPTLAMPLGYPTTQRLKQLLLEHLDAYSGHRLPEDLRLAVEERQSSLPELAGFVRKQTNTPEAWHNFLKQTFALLAADDCSYEVECLVRLPVRLWLTTSYDDCLVATLRAFLGQEVAELDDIPFDQLGIRQAPLPGVVRLHGRSARPETVVLTADDLYERRQKTARWKHMADQFGPLTALFVGFELGDETFKIGVESVRSLLGRPTDGHHYALVAVPEGREAAALNPDTRHLLYHWAIHPIPYRAIPSGPAPVQDQLLELLQLLQVPTPPLRLSACAAPETASRSAGKIETPHPPLRRRNGGKFSPERTRIGESSLIGRADLEEFQEAEWPERAQPRSGKSHRTIEHAKALGMLDPSIRSSHHVLERLLPGPLPFGLADCFHPVLDWRLDSPVVHVWVYTRTAASGPAEEEVMALTAVGEGLPHIRQQLESAAFNAALALPDAQSNIVTRGFIHLSADDNPTPPTGFFTGILGQIAALIGGSGKGQGLRLPTDAREALTSLKALCERLARETGFVEVHTRRYDDLRRFANLLDRQLKRPPAARASLLFRAVAERILLYRPYPYFPSKAPRLLLELSADLLDADELRALLGSYVQDVVVRMRADLERRIEFWTHELERDEAQYNWFRRLPPERQAREHDIRTNRQILEELGIDVQIQGSSIPAKVYYLHNMPQFHIPRSKEILKKLEAMRGPIDHLAESERSPIWHLCLARIFDCALRQVPLCDDPRINARFDDWRVLVDAMLRGEWRRLLTERCQVATAHVFKHTTFFSVRYDEKDDRLEVYPNAVIDSHRAVVTVHEPRRTMLVQDPLDEATTEPVTESEDAESGRRLREILEGEIDAARKSQRLRDGAFASPLLAQRICLRALAPPGETTSALGQLRESVRTKAQQARIGPRAWRLLMNLAYNSALEVVGPRDQANPPAGKALFLAVLACLESGLNPMTALKALRKGQGAVCPDVVVRPFRLALQSAPALVDRFLEEGALPFEDVSKTPAEERAWDLDHCCEAARLADLFQQAADSLRAEGETLASAFVKAEEAFEAAHGAVFALASPSLMRIQCILTGEPLTLEMAAEQES
jgi:hypothetical protein